MLLPPFHGDRMRAYDSLIEEESLEAFAAWPEGEEFASIEAFRQITMGVILRAVFGAKGPRRAELEEVLARQMTLGQMSVVFPILRRDFGRWSPGRMLANTRRRYDELIAELIDERLADPDLGERIDILAFILRSLQEDDQEINRSDLADELLTLLVAGSETTASSLAWAVERLTRHPDVLRRLEAEAESDSSALRDATVLEVLRTRPAIMSSGRRVTQPFELGPWRLPVGTVIMVANSTMQEDDRFHADALTFDPDRYVGRKPETYSWVPFGGGVRRCIGASFALMEMDVVLRTMLRHFELLPTTARPERERFRGVAHTPSKGGLVTVRRRRNPLGGGAVAPARATQPAPAARCPVDDQAAPAAAAGRST
jgi:cytochrome P450